MKILVIGSGGREHAICWKLTKSKNVEKLIAIPGNPGISEIAECVNININEIEKIINFVKINKIDLTIVGPEIPLMNGIVDQFENEKLLIFGPQKSAAMLEGSKIFAKNFMKRNSIPTADYSVFTKNEIIEAKNYIHSKNYPIVIKADGLAAGKGVVICNNSIEAENCLHEFFSKNIFGDSGSKIVIEDFMEGEEASIFVLTDGTKYLILPASQDHKKIYDGEKGKNTGGMGAYSPTNCVTDEILKKIEIEIIIPTLNGMKSEGNIYKGCLYIGLMLTNTGPKVVEFNSRFGDPETQAVLPICDIDFAEIFYQCAKGELVNIPKFTITKNAICVVCASNGYPDKYETGKEINGVDQFKDEENIHIFHAGTKMDNNKLVTNGGRVLGVTAIGEKNNFESTFVKVYNSVDKIKFDGIYFRHDIAKRAIE
ncbi:MAG: phosphoribosylamine--glycine ligase [Bacteroidetes bacterium]|nr:phosphoribosylamine--glycine ligase [Bacteroidota bacterium]